VGPPAGGGADPWVGSDDEHATPSSAHVRKHVWNKEEREEEERPIQAVGNVTVTQA
jgi:hypothetical protein